MNASPLKLGMKYRQLCYTNNYYKNYILEKHSGQHY